MPLIEVKDFPSTSKFLTQLESTTTEDLIMSWIGSTPFDIFVNQYKFRLIQKWKAGTKEEYSGITADYLLDDVIFEEKKNRHTIGSKYNYKMFLEDEFRFLTHKEVRNLPPHLENIKSSYFNFLKENKNKLLRIVNLHYGISDNWPALESKLQGMNNLKVIRPDDLESQIDEFFYEVDTVYEIFQKTFKNDREEPLQTKENFRSIEWEYALSPFHLKDNKLDMKIYHKAMIEKFREKLQDRKIHLYWSKTPNTYLFVEEFITALEQELANLNKPTETYNQPKVSITTQPEDYPKHIFASQQSYDFFCQLANFATMPVQISFVFRIMSEKENPPMIVVKDVPFRSWFNNQPHKLKVESVTSTYEKSSSNDKVWLYNTVKLLYFKE